MDRNILFENIIKLEEAASSGLNLTTKTKGNPALQFFLYLQRTLDCAVIFTKSPDDPACPKMKELLENPEVKALYDAENDKPKYLIIKGQNKTEGNEGSCKLYINQNFKHEIYDKFPDVKVEGDKATFTYEGKTYTVQESGAEEKSEKRTAKDGEVVANYLDDKILPSTKDQLDELFRDLDIVYPEDKTIPNVVKSIVHFSDKTASPRVENLVFEYSGSKNGTSNITYELDDDSISVLREAFTKIAENLEEKYVDVVSKVFDGHLYGSGLRAEYIEGSAILNVRKHYDVGSPYKVEFYCSQHFPLVDFVIVSGDAILPFSVKDENGGNKSTCCRFLKTADTAAIFSKFEEFKAAGFSSVNETLEKICANINWGYKNVTLKDGSPLEVGVEYPMGDTTNKQADWWCNSTDDEISDLAIYIASYLVKYSNRKDEEFSLKNLPGRIFNHFRLGPNGEKILKHNGKFILNQCEKVAVNIINKNRAVLDVIQDSIEGFSLATLGTPVIKIKPASNGFEIIEQSSKMKLRALSTRGGGGKLGIIKSADGEVQVTEVTTQGQGQFFGYEFVPALKESKNDLFDRILEYNQADFNRDAKLYMDQRARSSVSTKDKWNLKMDIAELKGDLIDLQNTASDLPDEFVDEICDTDSYPFDSPIDDDQSLNSWCNEMDAFLSQDLDNWGSKKK